MQSTLLKVRDFKKEGAIQQCLLYTQIVKTVPRQWVPLFSRMRPSILKVFSHVSRVSLSNSHLPRARENREVTSIWKKSSMCH